MAFRQRRQLILIILTESYLSGSFANNCFAQEVAVLADFICKLKTFCATRILAVKFLAPDIVAEYNALAFGICIALSTYPDNKELSPNPTEQSKRDRLREHGTLPQRGISTIIFGRLSSDDSARITQALR